MDKKRAAQEASHGQKADKPAGLPGEEDARYGTNDMPHLRT